MHGSSKILPVDPRSPEPERIQAAARIIRQGGLVVFPTTGLYGLGTDALSAEAVNRIFEIKGRPPRKPILVLISDKEQLDGLVKSVPPLARTVMDAFWPGRVTMVFEARESLPENLTAGTGKIGVRLCQHPVASALAEAVGGPITGTSANLSGQPGCSRADLLPDRIVQAADLVLDAGPLSGGAGSTVADITGRDLKILREGCVAGRDILSVVRKQTRNFVDKRT